VKRCNERSLQAQEEVSRWGWCLTSACPSYIAAYCIPSHRVTYALLSARAHAHEGPARWPASLIGSHMLLRCALCAKAANFGALAEVIAYIQSLRASNRLVLGGFPHRRGHPDKNRSLCSPLPRLDSWERADSVTTPSSALLDRLPRRRLGNLLTFFGVLGVSFGLPADVQVWLVLVYRYLANGVVAGSWAWLYRFRATKLYKQICNYTT
jgi:hypothetical protein